MWVIFLFLILLSAFFSASEIAFFSLGPAQVRLMINKKKKNANLIYRLKKKPQELLIAILIGNNVVNILGASLAAVISVKTFGNLGIGIATGIVTFLVLIFGEIVPKSIAQKKNHEFARFSAPWLYFFTLLLWPVTKVLVGINHIFLRKVFTTKKIRLVTEEEIKALTRLGVEVGAIEYKEREMIENVFSFNDISVGEIATPRYKVVSLNGDVPIEQISYFASQEGHSRYPVYINEEDNIIGYIHVNDLMRYLNSDYREKDLKKIIRGITRVSEGQKIEQVLRQMIKSKEHLFLVTKQDREAEIIGIITMEDILEELVGEIEDETDFGQKDLENEKNSFKK